MLLPGFPVGQFAERGYVIHFPVDTPFVCEQVWFKVDKNILFVPVSCSCHERVTPKRFIRPRKLYDAISWLKANNALYCNV